MDWCNFLKYNYCPPQNKPTFTNSSTSPNRFSLIHLNFGETYIEDFAINYYPESRGEVEMKANKQQGRLKLCSETLVFVPQDSFLPVIKIAYKFCSKLEQWKGHGFNLAQTIYINCSQVVHLLENNVIGPYQIIRQSKSYLFQLLHQDLIMVLQKIDRLNGICRLPLDKRIQETRKVSQEQFDHIRFQTMWLSNLFEQIVFEKAGYQVSPMIENPGRIALTNSNIYFQPLNNIYSEPVIIVKLSDLICVVKRRYLLTHVGIELFTNKGTSLFLALESQLERNNIFGLILSMQDTKLEQLPELSFMIDKWKCQELSNYEYLMYLNFLADRSFNDITQYPVLPWIITDYTSKELDLSSPTIYRDLSKPVGALNPEKLAALKKRFRDMPNPKYLYGTHYSTPAYVLHFLVRVYPEYLLCLQDGRFDHANRMFHSIQETWNHTLNGPCDVRELIPEFYLSSGEFLLNHMDLELGIRDSGDKVDNVLLPPWAKNANDFIRQTRLALESVFTSSSIHKWIDLVFGYKQRGEEALNSDNLFHYITYEGYSNYAMLAGTPKQSSLKIQIMEFGQTPKQLFTYAHPCRPAKHKPLPKKQMNDVTVNLSLSENIQAKMNDVTSNDQQIILSPTSDGWENISKMKLQTSYKLHKDIVTCLVIDSKGKNVISVSKDHTLRLFSLTEQVQIRNISISNMALSCCTLLPNNMDTILVGSWDNKIYFYSIEYANVLHCMNAHESSVTSISWNNNILVSGSWDTSVKIWRYTPSKMNGQVTSPQLLTDLDHDCDVSNVDIDNTGKLIASGCIDGTLTLWSVDTNIRVAELQPFDSPIHTVLFSPDGSKLSACSDKGLVLIYTVNSCGELHEIARRSCDEQCDCMFWNGEYILCGTKSGRVYVMSLQSTSVIAKIPAHIDSVTAITASNELRVVATAASNKMVSIWNF